MNDDELRELLQEAWDAGYSRSGWEDRGTGRDREPPEFDEWWATRLGNQTS